MELKIYKFLLTLLLPFVMIKTIFDRIWIENKTIFLFMKYDLMEEIASYRQIIKITPAEFEKMKADQK